MSRTKFHEYKRICKRCHKNFVSKMKYTKICFNCNKCFPGKVNKLIEHGKPFREKKIINYVQKFHMKYRKNCLVLIKQGKLKNKIGTISYVSTNKIYVKVKNNTYMLEEEAIERINIKKVTDLRGFQCWNISGEFWDYKITNLDGKWLCYCSLKYKRPIHIICKHINAIKQYEEMI